MNLTPADIHTLRQTIKYMENYLDATRSMTSASTATR